MSLSLDSNKTGHRKMDMKLENYPTCAVEALTRLGKLTLILFYEFGLNI